MWALPTFLVCTVLFKQRTSDEPNSLYKDTYQMPKIHCFRSNSGSKHGTRLLLIIKGKLHPRTVHEGPDGEKRYSSSISLTSVLDGVWWLTPRHAPAVLPSGKTRYPLYRMGGPQGRCGRVRKTSPSPEFDPRTVQPLANRYTD